MHSENGRSSQQQGNSAIADAGVPEILAQRVYYFVQGCARAAQAVKVHALIPTQEEIESAVLRW